MANQIKLTEEKDGNGDNIIKIVSGGNITYRSTEGYKNKKDMRTAAVNSAVAILEKYAQHLLVENR